VTDEAKPDAAPAQGDAPAPPAVRTDERDRDTLIAALRPQYGDTEFEERTSRGRQRLASQSESRQVALTNMRYPDGSALLNSPAGYEYATDPAPGRDKDLAAVDPAKFDWQIEVRIPQIETKKKWWPLSPDEERELGQLYRLRQEMNTRR